MLPLPPTVFHPLTDNVFCRSAIDQQPRQGHPVHSLQPVYQAGAMLETDYRHTVAAIYAAVVMREAPQGLMLPGGWSLGGLLALRAAALI